MGINLGSILATARNAITPLNEVMGAKASAEAQANKERVQLAIQQAMMQRQAQQMAVENALHQSQMHYYDARSDAAADKANQPKYMRGPGGQIFDVTDPTKITPVGPAPVQKQTPYPVVSAAEGVFERRPDGLYDVATGQRWTGGTLHPTATMGNYVFPTGTGSNGEPEIFSGNTKTGRLTPTGVDAKPIAGSMSSGQTLQTLARMGMSMNDLQRAIDEMTAYENNPANLSKLTPFKQAVGATAEVTPNPEARGLTGVLSNGVGSYLSGKAQQTLASSDPAYRQYIFNKQRVGTAFTELLPRPNQQLLGIEKGLSGIDVGWSPALIGDVQARRLAGLQMLRRITTGTPVAGASGASGTPGNINLGGAPSTAPRAPKGAAKPRARKPIGDYGVFGPKPDDTDTDTDEDE